MTQLSPHFTLAEMTVSETAARKGIDNRPSQEVVANLVFLCSLLEEVRALFTRPVVITSGYRSAALNKAIGGSATSAHQYGLAADFIIPPLTPLDVCLAIHASSIVFDQLIHEHAWTHFGVRLNNAMRRETLTLAKSGGYLRGLSNA